jgi:hypothetical protein
MDLGRARYRQAHKMPNDWPVFIAAIVVLVGLIASCTTPLPGRPVDSVTGSEFTTQEVLVGDGRKVLCLFWEKNGGSQNSSSGMSCDWGGAK